MSNDHLSCSSTCKSCLGNTDITAGISLFISTVSELLLQTAQLTKDLPLLSGQPSPVRLGIQRLDPRLIMETEDLSFCPPRVLKLYCFINISVT